MNAKGKGKSDATKIGESAKSKGVAESSESRIRVISTLAKRVERVGRIVEQHHAAGGHTDRGSPTEGSGEGSGKRRKRRRGVRAAVSTPAGSTSVVSLPKGGKVQIYTNKLGKEVARSTRVSTLSPFTQRHSAVGQKNYAGKAVGLSESSIYHGSKTVEHDFVRDGVRGTRLAGSQYLSDVSIDHLTGIGERIAFVLVNPTAFGSILAKMAEIYEQCKLMHMKVVYKPVVPATTKGAIAVYFRNDVQNPLSETGLEELQHAATHEAFVDSTVWSPFEVEIKPSNAVLKFWDEISGDPSNDMQGMITVISSSVLEPDTTGGGVELPTTFGHLYLEYDYEFFSPEVDYEVDEVGEFALRLNWPASYAPTQNVAMKFNGVSGVIPSFSFSGTTPVDTDVVLYGVCRLATKAGSTMNFFCQEDPENRWFVPGQGYFFRFTKDNGGSVVSWNAASVNCWIFQDLESALVWSGDSTATEATENGQLINSTGTAGSGGLTLADFKLRALPMSSSEV